MSFIVSLLPGSCNEEGTFTLLNHSDQNLSTEESIEHIDKYFAQISQEHPPLDSDSLPQRVRDVLNHLIYLKNQSYPY